MKDRLAEKILAKTMKWDALTLKNELSILQTMSALKYDEYQQFINGKQFIESLALWLERFEEKDRQLVYAFVRDHIIFISEQEMQQLVSVAFEEFIKREIAKKAKKRGKPSMLSLYDRKEIYTYFQRKTLFLGLSDGAHMDYFRRHNSFLTNEQVFMHYDFSEKKYEGMRKDLQESLKQNYPELDVSEERFESFVLIDDFSGSGISYIRKEHTKDGDKWKGKIYKFVNSILSREQDISNISIHIILYIATENAVNNIKDSLRLFLEELGKELEFTVGAVQYVKKIELAPELESVLKRDYDSHNHDKYESFLDEHFRKGNIDKPYLGFNGCCLPLVLYHNTPNNSISAIWYGWNKKTAERLARRDEALFPRITRHKEN